MTCQDLWRQGHRHAVSILPSSCEHTKIWLSETAASHTVTQAQGWPWVVRKTCSKFGQRATDIVQLRGQTLTVATLNAKGVWSRRYTEGKELSQPNAAGVMCKTTAWWEGEREGPQV